MNKSRYRLFTLIAAAAAFSLVPVASASAATIFVGKSGSGGGSCTKPNFKNIAAAVSAASANDTIHICKGTWTGTSNRGIQFAKPLKFVGDGSGQTIIDAQDQDYIFNGTSGALTVSKMTLKDGNNSADNSAAVWAEDGGSNTPFDVTVDHVVFTSNETGDYGSAIYGDNVDVSDSSFSGNSAGSDGTVYAENSATVTRSTFKDNTVGDDGGGVFVNSDGPADYDLTVTDSVFTDNNGSSGYYGGTLTAYNGGAKILRTSVKGGATSEYGGGLYSDENAVISDSVFEANTSAYDGAGVYASSDLNISDTLFKDNVTEGSGGGAYVGGFLTSQNVEYASNEADYGGGAGVDGGAIVSGDVFDSNTAGEGGGGLYVGGGLTLLLSSFDGNSAEGNGGALEVSGGGSDQGVIEQSLFSANSAGNSGGAIVSDSDVDVSLLNSTLTGNTAAGDWSAVFGNGDLIVRSSTVADNGLATGVLSASGGDLTIGNSIIKGPGTCAAIGSSVNENFNVITNDNTGCDDFVGTTPAAKVSVAALDLQPLADNGGPTRTRAIKPTSAAANTGDPDCPVVDQRNWTRVGSCDSGAFGIGALAPQPTLAKAGKAGAKSLKVRVGCKGGSPCTILVGGKLKGGKGSLEGKVVEVPEGETVLVTLKYTKKLAKELADKGGRQTIRVTAERLYGASRSVNVPWQGPEPKPVTG